MQEEMKVWLEWLGEHAELETLVASAALIFAAWLANWVVKRILV